MARLARIVAPGTPHHVTQRGNRGADVYFDQDDRQKYCALLKSYGEKHGLQVWAYCLMTNHVHLIVVPAEAASLAAALRDAHTVYALRVNRRQGLTGHLWQGRFFSSVLDERYLWAAVRYVERNPVRAGLVERAESYPWSSAAAHCGLRTDLLLSPEFPSPGEIDDWSAWLGDEDEAALAELRKQTHTGRPCGSATFLEGLEKLLGRSVRPGKRGRRPTPRAAKRARRGRRAPQRSEHGKPSSRRQSTASRNS